MSSRSHTHSHAPTRRPVPLGFTQEEFPEGTHICYLYSDDEEHKRFMSEYVSSGILDKECVTYLADTGPDTLQAAVAELGIAVSEIPENRLTLATSVETYCPGGQFVPEHMLAKLRETYANHPDNCDGVRLAAEMTWALQGFPGSERLVEYEGRINELLKTYPLTTLCQYDTRRFGGATIFELLNVHPVMIVHGQIMRNPFYVPPDATAKKNSGGR